MDDEDRIDRVEEKISDLDRKLKSGSFSTKWLGIPFMHFLVFVLSIIIILLIMLQQLSGDDFLQWWESLVDIIP